MNRPLHLQSRWALIRRIGQLEREVAQLDWERQMLEQLLRTKGQYPPIDPMQAPRLKAVKRA